MIAVSGGKGGTGKTTVALGLAVALVERRREPIIIDADVDMPNLHLRADVDDTGLETLAEGGTLTEATSTSNRYPGVSVVGATPGVDLERALRNVITDRPVLLDGSAGASKRAVTPLSYADQTVLVTRDTPAAITDTVKSIRMSRAVGTPIAGIVVNRTDRVPDSVRRTLTAGPIHSIPTTDEPVVDDRARVAYDSILHNWANA